MSLTSVKESGSLDVKFHSRIYTFYGMSLERSNENIKRVLFRFNFLCYAGPEEVGGVQDIWREQPGTTILIEFLC